VRYWSDWDFAGAEREFRRAVELDPENGRGWYYLSNLLSATLGRHAEGLAAARRAVQLDSIQWGSLSLGIRVAAGEADVVLDSLAAVVRAHPDDERTLGMLCGTAYSAGRYASALQCHRQLEARAGRPRERLPASSSSEGVMLAATGHRAEAEAILRELMSASENDYVAPDYIAAIYAHLGDRDRAFEWLERAYRGRSAWLVYLNTLRLWDPLRADPRFGTLLDKVGLRPPAEGGSR
ncbi:MAG TPA: BTAD domain-containing putative transcriptional regulator, partial [Longimicrobium sp.]|nr:BTAD domain-containing putative transcriptional regulator [Longimicrobium sp.]